MKAQRGLSFVEVILFMIIISVGFMGMFAIFNMANKSSADPLIEKQAVLLAEAMLDEVMAKSFAPGGYTGTDRAQFDDISDYAGFNSAEVAGIKALDGTVVVGLEDYVLRVDVTSAALNSIPATDVKVIKVTIKEGGRIVTELTGYRTNYE